MALELSSRQRPGHPEDIRERMFYPLSPGAGVATGWAEIARISTSTITAASTATSVRADGIHHPFAIEPADFAIPIGQAKKEACHETGMDR
jgi:hypothetical protein